MNTINSFSTATDYIKGASGFFLNVFDTGAGIFERVRNTITNLKEPQKVEEPEKMGFLESITQDKEKAIAILAIALLAGGLILAARK